MVQLSLPKNSVPIKGNSYSNVDLLDEQSQQNHDIRVINVYRWSGDENTPPQIDRFEIDVKKAGTMVLDILNQIKAELDPSLTFRKSCSCLLYTSPSPRDRQKSRMPSSA